MYKPFKNIVFILFVIASQFGFSQAKMPHLQQGRPNQYGIHIDVNKQLGQMDG